MCLLLLTRPDPLVVRTVVRDLCIGGGSGSRTRVERPEGRGDQAFLTEAEEAATIEQEREGDGYFALCPEVDVGRSLNSPGSGTAPAMVDPCATLPRPERGADPALDGTHGHQLINDVAALAQRMQQARGQSFKIVVNEAPRHGLRAMAAPSAPSVPYRTPAVDLGANVAGRHLDRG